MQTTLQKIRFTFFATLLTAAVVLPYANPPADEKQPTIEELQREIQRLKITVEVKQQRIDLLERELEQFRIPQQKERERKIVREIQQEVERLRGLPAKTDVEMAPLTEEKIMELMERELAGQYTDEQFRGWEMSLKHLGMLPRKMKVREFFKALYVEQAAGLYDDETKSLYVSDKFDISKSFSKMILAHEICHALQDQNFNLTSSPIKRIDNDDDRAMAALSVIEGDATLLMVEYFGDNPSWNMLLELPGMLMMDQSTLNSAPNFMVQSLLFPYMQGMQFVQYDVNPLWPRQRKNRLLNSLHESYPRSTEQIIHPWKYFGRSPDEPTEIDLSGLLEGDLLPESNRYESVAGEFGIKTMLMGKLKGDVIDTASGGWDGDRFVFGGDIDGDYALAWLSVWDTRQDAREFAEALIDYFVEQRPDLEGHTADDKTAARLADEQGVIDISTHGQAVVCVHAKDEKRIDPLVERLTAIASETEITP